MIWPVSDLHQAQNFSSSFSLYANLKAVPISNSWRPLAEAYDSWVVVFRQQQSNHHLQVTTGGKQSDFKAQTSHQVTFSAPFNEQYIYIFSATIQYNRRIKLPIHKSPTLIALIKKNRTKATRCQDWLDLVLNQMWGFSSFSCLTTMLHSCTDGKISNLSLKSSGTKHFIHANFF